MNMEPFIWNSNSWRPDDQRQLVEQTQFNSWSSLWNIMRNPKLKKQNPMSCKDALPQQIFTYLCETRSWNELNRWRNGILLLAWLEYSKDAFFRNTNAYTRRQPLWQMENSPRWRRNWRNEPVDGNPCLEQIKLIRCHEPNPNPRQTFA